MKKFKNQFMAAAIAATMLVPGVTTFGAPKSFTDVSSDFWGYSTINKLVEKNIIDGYDDGSFKPNGTINADAFIKLVICSLGYNDIEKNNDYWALPYIQKAIDLELVKGGEFDYMKPITREGMALIISRALKNEQVKTIGSKSVNWYEWYRNNKTAYTYLDLDTEVKNWTRYDNTVSFELNKQDYYNHIASNGKLYTIADQIKEKEAFMFFYDWYKTTEPNREALARVLTLGVMSGYTDQTLKPQGTATRAEASSIILRMIDKNVRVQNNFKAVSYSTNYTTAEVAKKFTDVGMQVPQIVVYNTVGYNWFDLWIDNAKELENTDYKLNWKCISHPQLNTFDMLQPNGVWKTMNFSQGKLPINDVVGYSAYQLSKSFYTTREIAKTFDLYPGMVFVYQLTVSSEKLGKEVKIPITITLIDNTQCGN